MLRMIGLGLCLLAIWFASEQTALADGLKVSSDFEGARSASFRSTRNGGRLRSLPAGTRIAGGPAGGSSASTDSATDRRRRWSFSGSPAPARNNGRHAGKPLDSGWAMPERASVSHDGSSWRHTEPGERAGAAIRYKVVGTGGPLWVA